MKQKLSDGQERALGFIRDYTRGNGFSPSTRDLATFIGTSKTAAAQYINVLVRKGWVRKAEGKARAITIL